MTEQVLYPLCCPQCACERFYVYADGDILCSECACEVVAERGNDITLH